MHEQRQDDQREEGIVKKAAPAKKGEVRPPTQSLVDQERGDWEGMGQSQHKPA